MELSKGGCFPLTTPLQFPSLLLPKATAVHPDTFHQRDSALPHVFRMTFLHHQNFRSPTNPPGDLDQTALGHNRSSKEDTKSLWKEYLKGGTDGFGGRAEEKYKTTTRVVPEKLEEGAKNGKVTP